MKILIAACLLLAGCDQIPTYKCIDGNLYQRMGGPDKPWSGVDAAPSHKGFTPTPCKPADTER